MIEIIKGDEGEVSFFRKYLKFFLVAVGLIILVAIAFFFIQSKTCGDGTFYGRCSSNKPYFCEQGVLIEKADLCECPANFEIQNEKCISEYMTGEQTIFLPYSVKNLKGEIEFNIYDGFYNYSKKLSRFIEYPAGETPSRKDFKIKSIDGELQREFLIPIVVQIQNLNADKKIQAEIAVSLVQNIPYYASPENLSLLKYALDSRYPYEVVYENKGICGEKSDLLAFLLKELGYGVAILYYPGANHESVGIKCPFYKDFEDIGYCYIETTSFEDVKLYSPEVIEIADGKSF